MTENIKDTVTWKAPEYEYREKDIAWYWLTIIVAIALLGVALWQRNFLFGVFIVIAEVLLIVWGYERPKTIAFTLSSRGLSIDQRKRYAWNELQSFSVNENDVERGELVDIHLNFENHFRPTLKIKVEFPDIEKVRAAFGTRIPETEWNPTFTDAFERWTGF